MQRANNLTRYHSPSRKTSHELLAIIHLRQPFLYLLFFAILLFACTAFSRLLACSLGKDAPHHKLSMSKTSPGYHGSSAGGGEDRGRVNALDGKKGRSSSSGSGDGSRAGAASVHSRRVAHWPLDQGHHNGEYHHDSQ